MPKKNEIEQVMPSKIKVLFPASNLTKNISTDALAETSGKTILEEITENLPGAAEMIQQVATEFGQHLSSMAESIKPDETTVELKMQFAGEGNTWVVKVSGEAQIVLTMVWKKKEKPTEV